MDFSALYSADPIGQMTGPLGQQPAPESLVDDPRDPRDIHTARHIKRMVDRVLSLYPTEDGASDAINRDYFCGQQWRPKVPGQQTPDTFQATRNEIFPLVAEMQTALATSAPQVEYTDARAWTSVPPQGAEVGRCLAGVYNHWANQEDLGSEIQVMVQNALVFDKGGVILVSWDAAKGCPVWTSLEPDEVFFDTTARRPRDCAWAFQLMSVHNDDYQQRLDSGVYRLPDAGNSPPKISPDEAPRPMMDTLAEPVLDAAYRQLDKSYHALIAWYDMRGGICYHLHRETGALLGKFSMPVKNPFIRFTPIKVPGKNRYISLISLLRESQCTINDLVAGRKEVVYRMGGKVMMSADLWKDDASRERFLRAKLWEVSMVDPPPDTRAIADKVFVTPAPNLGLDFNAHLAQELESMRRIAGSAGYMRGQVDNIRTAEEAMMIQGAVEARVATMNDLVVQSVTRMFEVAREFVKWAIRTPEHSNLNVAALAEVTQSGAAPDQLAAWLMEDGARFSMQAFNPIMKDAHTKRQALQAMMPTLLGHPIMAQAINLYALACQIVQQWGLPPDVMVSPDEFAANLKAMSGAQEGAAPEAQEAPQPVASEESLLQDLQNQGSPPLT